MHISQTTHLSTPMYTTKTAQSTSATVKNTDASKAAPTQAETITGHTNYLSSDAQMIVIAESNCATLSCSYEAYQNAASLPRLSPAITGELDFTNMIDTSEQNSLEENIVGYRCPEYTDIIQNPDTFVEKYADDYNTFLSDAQSMLQETTSLDPSNYFDVNINAFGSIIIRPNEHTDISQLTSNQQEARQQTHEDLRTWAEEHQDEAYKIADKVQLYAIAKSVQDYTEATGIKREDLETNEQITEYGLRMISYAGSAFGTNPASYADVEARKPFAFTYVDGTVDGVHKPVNILPDITTNVA